MATNQTSTSAKSVSLGHNDYLRFRDLVLEHSGLYFSERKRVDLELGLKKALAQSPLATQNNQVDLDEYYRLLMTPSGQNELNRLINALTVGETYFFRDEAQFNALSGHVLPQLIRQKRAAAAAVGLGVRPQLRIWSAGCASGEEPYSLAILLRELIPDIDNWYILILATDINADALERAREATYSDWSFRENRAKALRPRYFKPVSTASPTRAAVRYQLRADIRRMVTFAPLNLITTPYPAIESNTVSMDLILCRNVTIYFTEPITRQVVKQFHQALVDGGWLVVGHSEPSIFVYRNFQAHTFPNTLLYQKGDQATTWPAAWPESQWPASEQSVAPLPANGRPKPALPEAVRPPSEPLKPSPVEVCQQARKLLDDGQLEQARTRLRQLLAETPDHAPAYTLLARSHANQGQWKEAQRSCHHALQLDSLQVDAYRVLALVHENQDELQLAIDALKKAIYLERQSPLDHFNLAMLYRRIDQPEQAGRALSNVIKLLQGRPSAEILPETGGSTTVHLLRTAQAMLQQLSLQNEVTK